MSGPDRLCSARPGPARLCSTRLGPDRINPEQLNPAQLDSVRLGVRADRGAPPGDGHFRVAADRSDPSPRLDGGVGVRLRTSRLAPVPGPVMQVSGPKRRTEGSGGAVGRGTGAVGRDGLTFRLRRVRRVRPGGGAGAVGAVASGGLRRRKGGCAGTRRRSNRDGTAPGRGGRPAGRNAARPNFPAARRAVEKRGQSRRCTAGTARAALSPAVSFRGVTRCRITPFVSMAVEHRATCVPRNGKVGWNYELPWTCCEEREYDVRACFPFPDGWTARAGRPGVRCSAARGVLYVDAP